jgi:hypothetical protein
VLGTVLRTSDDPRRAGLPVPWSAHQSTHRWGPVLPPPAGPATARIQDTLRTAAQWEEMFIEQWVRERPVADRLSRSRDSWDQYGLAYDIDALTAICLATGKSEYADEGLRLLENLVTTATASWRLPTSQYRDEYLGWVSQQDDVRGQEVPLYESYLWRYGVWLLNLVRTDPALWHDATRRVRYQRLLSFAEHDIFAKWLNRGADDTLYRRRTHLASHWGMIALGLARLTTQDARRQAYLQTVHAIDNGLPNSSSSLRGQLRMNPDHPSAYLWHDEWGATRRPGQDVSHGNAVISYVVAANSVGVEWNNVDMRRFLNTFRLAIWPERPRKGQPEGAEYVDGSGTGSGWFSDGFVKLGRFDPQVQHRLETHDVGRSPQFLANGALNAALLACQGDASALAPRDTPACRTTRPPP